MEYYCEDLGKKPTSMVTELVPPVPAVRRGNVTRRVLWRQCVASAVLCALILTAQMWWPQAGQYLKEQLVGGEIGQVEAAAQGLIRNVMGGEPVPEAIAVFCQEVLDAQD